MGSRFCRVAYCKLKDDVSFTYEAEESGIACVISILADRSPEDGETVFYYVVNLSGLWLRHGKTFDAGGSILINPD